MIDHKKMSDLSSMPSRIRKIYLGRFHPFLEHSLCSEIKRVRIQDRLSPIVILVGSNLLGLYLRRMLAQELGSLFNVRFLTFIDLARLIVSETMMTKGKREMPLLGDKLIMDEFLKRRRDLKYFSGMANYKGFKEALLAAIEDLKEAGISPSAFEKIIQKLRESGGSSFIKLRELARIYRSYSETLLEKGFYDRSDLMLEAIRQMRQEASCLWKALQYPQDTSPPFFLYGFYDFNFIQKSLLEECIRLSHCISFLPYKETPAYQYAAKTYSWFQRLGFLDIKEEKSIGKKGTLLDQLKEKLFVHTSSSSGERGDDGTFEIISAPGEIREVREILRAIISLISDNAKFGDIGLFLRNRENYLHLMQESFDRNEISYFTPSSYSLSQTKEGKSLLLFLSLIESDYDRGDVMEFLHLADIDLTRLFKESSLPSLSDWDVISMQAGIVSGKNEWMSRLERYIEKLKEEHPFDEMGEKETGNREKIEEAKRFLTFMRIFFERAGSIPLMGTWGELSERIWDSYKGLIKASEHRSVLEQALKEMSHLERIHKKTTRQQFLEYLMEKLKSTTQKKGQFQDGGVTITNLATGRGICFKMIIAPGLVEKEFPIMVRQDPILLDADREKINAFFPEDRLSLKMDRIEEEKLLFDLLVTSAQEKLILTFPRINPETSAERVPSSFLLEASESLIGEKVDFEDLEKLPFFTRIPLSQLFPRDEKILSDELEYDLKTIVKARQRGKESDAYFLKDGSSFFKNALMAESCRWGKRIFTPYDGVLKDRRALQLLKRKYSVHRDTISATSLERYAACPFQYFCEKILRLKILEEPEKIVTISALDKGWLIHAILFEFFESLKKEKGLPLKKEKVEDYLHQLESISKRHFSRLEQMGRTGFPMMWDIEKEAILEDLKKMIEVEIEQSDNFIPSYFEVRFGMPESEALEGSFSIDAPIALNLGDGKKIFLKGRIDRIDLSEDRREGKVIDYKTGMVIHKNNSFMAGQALQLPLYIMVAEKLLRENLKMKVHFQKAEYFYVTRRGEFRRRHFDHKEWHQKLKNLKEIVRIISRGMERGLFFHGGQTKVCSRCDYRLLCGSSTDVRFQMKKVDPIIKDYLKMLSIP